jgi:hypothetical protein
MLTMRRSMPRLQKKKPPREPVDPVSVASGLTTGAGAGGVLLCIEGYGSAR